MKKNKGDPISFSSSQEEGENKLTMLEELLSHRFPLIIASYSDNNTIKVDIMGICRFTAKDMKEIERTTEKVFEREAKAMDFNIFVDDRELSITVLLAFSGEVQK